MAQRKKKRPPQRPRPPANAQRSSGSSASRQAAGASGPTAGTSRPGGQTATKPTRQERLQAVQRQRRRQRLFRRGLAVGALLVVLGVIATVIVANRRASERTISRLEAGSCQFDRRTDPDQGQGRNHVTGSPVYQVNPPAGGNHLATAASPGVYTDTVPPDGQLVHAMEHGDVVLWHKPDVPADVLNQLRDMVNTYERDVLVVPRPTLTTAVAATAWHRRLLCPSFEREPIDRFIRSFRDKGPEKLEED